MSVVDVLNILVLSLAAATSSDLPSAEETRFFEEKVQPILERSCFDCHSHQSGKMKNGLTLDSREGWAVGGESGPAIVPGDPNQSLLIRAVRYQDPNLQMPPKTPLPEAEVAILANWVRRGAPDPRRSRAGSSEAPPVAGQGTWWSLQPLVRPPLPKGASHPVDAFVDAKLRAAGLKAQPEASRRILIRRARWDLHGLLPTTEEVNAFEHDPAADAYEGLVERLLASPRYGERWARHWLDTIHFADTHGFEHDLMRTNAWRYRDYVIGSFNHDTPWPRFIREQLAADALYPDEPALTAALGFLGAGPWDQSTAQTAPKTFEYLDRDDMVTQTMATFVSSTVNCARCHDHKFDPISQNDYYALQAVFAGVGRGDLLFDEDPARAGVRQGWKHLLAAADRPDPAVLLTAENRARIADWEQRRGNAAEWHTLVPDVFLTSSAAVLKASEDGAILAQGPRPETDLYTLSMRVDLPIITALRLEVLADPSLPKNGPGRQDNGNLHLSELVAHVFRPGAAEPERVKFRSATADFNQEGWTIQQALDGNEKTAWGIHPREGESHTAVFELEKALVLERGTRLAVQLKQLHGQGHLVGKFRLAITADEPARTSVLPLEIAEVRRLRPKERSQAQELKLAAYVLRDVAEAELAALPPPARVYAAGPEFVAVAEGGFYKPWAEPKTVYVLKRGEISKPGALASPGALSAVAAVPSRFDRAGSTKEADRRVALADWLAHPENPLTWRSAVNRVWRYHFGTGLSDTLNDFGRMGSLPSHPELLDWLACEFRDSGGSVKTLHRLILTSAAYRRAAGPDDAAGARDPENRLLWRWRQQRQEAEVFRDSVLALAGRLNLAMGGPGVQQFKLGKPIQITPTVDYAPYDWNSPGAGRRSIYRFVYRGLPDPFMESLDFPDAAQLAPVRPFSASALQALAFWNADFVLFHCERMAERLERTAPTVAEQVRAAVRWTWLREPTLLEREELTSYASTYGLAALCRVLLNSNEFLFIN